MELCETIMPEILVLERDGRAIKLNTDVPRQCRSYKGGHTASKLHTAVTSREMEPTTFMFLRRSCAWPSGESLRARVFHASRRLLREGPYGIGS
jgi:hypothetical protein